jgi:hypothetical protein
MAVVVFDTSVLLLAIHPEAAPPADPETKVPLEYPKQRVDYLIRKLQKNRSKVVIPAPALSELLVHAGSADNEYVTKLNQTPFSVAPFGNRAAIECAKSISKYGIKGKGKENPRAKVKFDRQIVAIAQVSRAEAIYSDDADIYRYAKNAGIKVIRSYELELDPDDLQHKLDFDLTTSVSGVPKR